MPRPSSARCWPLFTISFVVLAAVLVHAEKPAGRFLFAGDDDWDWASPLGAEKPSKLVRYGVMPWSALDWAEEGLEEVRGVLVGIPPDAKKTMSMEELSELRGEKATYRHHQQAAGVFKTLLEGKDPPNVLILMQNISKGGALEPNAIATLTGYVKRGGRLVVLDDWKRYQALLDAFVQEALKLPPGPPLEEPPEPGPAKVEHAPKEPEPAKTKPVDPDLKKQFEELLPQLGAEKFRARDEASKAMRALGREVLELLDEVETDDPEIASRLAEIRKNLEPGPARNAQIKASQEAQRKAKYHFNVQRVKSVAQKLREARIPHHLTDVLVDRDKKLLPSLRIQFPVTP